MQPPQHQIHFCNSFHSKESFSVLLVFGFLSLWLASVQGDDYLKEAPSFLIPCQLHDPQNGACVAKAFENVFTNWREGIPGLKNLSGIDPFHIKKIHAVQSNQNINLKMDFKDIQIKGLSKTQVLKASIDNNYNMKFLVKVPSLRTQGKYRMKGSILLLNVDSTGTMESEICNYKCLKANFNSFVNNNCLLALADSDVFFSLKTKLIKENNQSFFDLTSIQSSVKNIANFHIHFDNLFNGNSELGESANAIFNQNWREIFEIMRSTVEETMNTLTFDRYMKIFHYVPANYFIMDLP